MGKGATKNKFDTLATRDHEKTQFAHLKTKFELAENSFLGEKAVPWSMKNLRSMKRLMV